MRKEIELLYRWYKGARDTDDFSELYDKTEELLAQFEQDPVTKEPTETNMYDVYRKGQVAWGLYDLDSDMFISIYGYEERPVKILKNRFKWVKVYLAPPELEPVELEDVIKQLHNKWRIPNKFDIRPSYPFEPEWPTQS